jgi:hypothetical protein
LLPRLSFFLISQLQKHTLLVADRAVFRVTLRLKIAAALAHIQFVPVQMMYILIASQLPAQLGLENQSRQSHISVWAGLDH